MIWQKRSLGKVIILLHIWTFIILICVYFVNHRNIYSWISAIICSKIEHLYKLIDVYLHLCLIYHLCRLTALQYPYWLNQNAGEPIPVDPVSPVFAASCWFAAQFFCKLGSLWACCSACTLCVSVSYCIILFCFPILMSINTVLDQCHTCDFVGWLYHMIMSQLATVQLHTATLLHKQTKQACVLMIFLQVFWM